jgi:hypothetical protein
MFPVTRRFGRRLLGVGGVTRIPSIYCKDGSRPTQQKDDESDEEDRSEYAAADVHLDLLKQVQRSSGTRKSSPVGALPHVCRYRFVGTRRRRGLYLSAQSNRPLWSPRGVIEVRLAHWFCREEWCGIGEGRRCRETLQDAWDRPRA